MSGNPYSLVFGQEPQQLISRHMQKNEIISTFSAEDHAPSQIFMITGVRGSGKTVLLTEIAKHFKSQKNWVTVDLNPERDLLSTLVAKLTSHQDLLSIFKAAKINLSFLGFGIEIAGEPPVRDIEVALDRMLSSMKSHGKKLLIAIDEVSNTQTMREFAGTFQILLRHDLPIFLIMTGLYENIRSLQDARNLTFLHRAPRIELRPLNIKTIADNYRKNLPVTDAQALYLAKMTNGYSFAFQVLGYLVWNEKKISPQLERDYLTYLEDYVYDKVWSELSEVDKKVVIAIAEEQSGKIKSIRERLSMETNQFNPYRKRLIDKGLVFGDERGYISFLLPLFGQFALDAQSFDS